MKTEKVLHNANGLFMAAGSNGCAVTSALQHESFDPGADPGKKQPND
jgi:hypothetical protein